MHTNQEPKRPLIPYESLPSILLSCMALFGVLASIGVIVLILRTAGKW